MKFGRDAVQRMNFLQQASTYLAQVVPEPSSSSKAGQKGKQTSQLSKSMISHMRDIGQKSVQRMYVSL
jgi:hypothetical protein